MATRTNIKSLKAKQAGAVIGFGGAVVVADSLAAGTFDLSNSPLLDAAFKLLEEGQEEKLLAQAQQLPAADKSADKASEPSSGSPASIPQAEQLAPEQAIKAPAVEQFLSAQAPTTPDASGMEQADDRPQLVAQLQAPASGTDDDDDEAGAILEGSSSSSSSSPPSSPVTPSDAEASALLPVAAGAGLGTFMAGVGAVVAVNNFTGDDTAGSLINDNGGDTIQALSFDTVKLSVLGQSGDKASPDGMADSQTLISAGSKFFDNNIF
jgi:hypothetical protein